MCLRFCLYWWEECVRWNVDVPLFKYCSGLTSHLSFFNTYHKITGLAVYYLRYFTCENEAHRVLPTNHGVHVFLWCNWKYCLCVSNSCVFCYIFITCTLILGYDIDSLLHLYPLNTTIKALLEMMQPVRLKVFSFKSVLLQRITMYLWHFTTILRLQRAGMN